MAVPHPGKWKPIFVKPAPGQQPDVVLNTEHIAAHACLIYKPPPEPKWKVLYHLSYNREGQYNLVQTRIWDPNPALQDPISAQDIPDWSLADADPPRLFCCGQTFMSNGKLLAAGGIRVPGLNAPAEPPHYPDPGNTGLDYTYIFDPIDEVQPWKVAEGPRGKHAMAGNRYYPTLTHLGDIPSNSISGKIVVMSGWTVEPNINTIPEYYDEIEGWKPFPFQDSAQPFAGPYDLYPGAHLIPFGPNAGKILYCIPMKQSWVFNPFWNGTGDPGYWTQIGLPRDLYRLNGTTTMLPLLYPYNSAKVIIMGGSASYEEYDPANNSAEVIDIATAGPATQWTFLNNFLFFARKNHVSINLPNDMLFVVGGNRIHFGQEPVYTTELIDTSDASPTNWRSIMHPGQVYPREHHTTGLLLPDATVWLAGGGGGVHPSDYVYHAEIYEPGYLFEGDRPIIISAPNSILYDNTFTINTTHQIAAIRLISLGAVTHSTEMNQRSVGLNFQPTGQEYTYTVYSPPDKNIAPPGLYMLFVLRPKDQSLSGETMIPSVAKIVMLSD